MSLTDVVSSLQQIQAQLAQLGSLPTPATAAAANASAFAEALDGVSDPSAGGSVPGVAGVTGTGSPTGSVTGGDVVNAALQYVGTPYVLGGESKRGIDCSGLVQRAFADLGVKVPRLVHEQQTIGQPVASLKDAKPGDLVVLNGGDHIAIWLGNNTVVHAPYEGRTVSVQKAWFTDKDVVTIRRVVPSEAAAASPGGTADGAATSLASLMSVLGGSGAAGSGTAQQLLAARAALSGGIS